MRHFYHLLGISLGFICLLTVALLLHTGGGAAHAVAPGGLTATPTPSPSRTPHVCTVIAGEITGSDPTQAGGLNPNGPTSVCMYWPGCPGLVDTLPRHYDLYRFINLSSLYQCITVQLDAPGCTGANAVISAAYHPGFYDPANPCALYQAGTALSPSGSYSFYIPCCARGGFDLVVAEANPGAGCAGYTITVLSDASCPTGPTATPTITNTPTPTRTPTATPTCITTVLEWRAVPAPNPGFQVTLNAVDAVAPADVWAVGYYTTSGGQLAPLSEHWDGQGWNVVPVPTVIGGLNILTDVVALAPNDVWAVGGAFVAASGGWETLTQHWDGAAWTIVPSPGGAGATLTSVAASGAGDVWAVGYANDRTLALHWNGQAWSVVSTPNVGPGGNILLGVAAVAANDVWAVGRYYDPLLFWFQTLALHWNGSAWSIVASPNTAGGANMLYGVTAVAANDVWAVGMGNGWPLTEHWDGQAWSIVPSPTNGNNLHYLYAVAAVASDNVWAAGAARNVQAPYRTLLEHWNGARWGVAPSPNSGVTDNVLFGITALSPTDWWAVGAANGALTLHYTYWPCGAVTPAPTRSPTPTLSATQVAATPTLSATQVAAPPTRSASPTGTPCAVTFTDVDPTHPFYGFIRCLACREIVSGYADGTFRPYADVTRGQLAKILAGAAGFQDPVPSGQQTFADVPPTHPFWLPAERLTAHGAISGYTCGGPGEPCDPQSRPYFRPDASATRGQITKIDAVAAQIADPIPTTRQTFADVPPTNPFWVWIEQLAGRQIVSGYLCGGPGEPCDPAQRPYFRWGAATTRGQMSKIAAQTFFPGCQTPARW
jgi:hypothetical protein